MWSLNIGFVSSGPRHASQCHAKGPCRPFQDTSGVQGGLLGLYEGWSCDFTYTD